MRAGRDGIYFAPGGLLTQGGKVAFLFPGVEAESPPPVDDNGLMEPGSLKK